jgi:two-component system chemotaxis sensor kinase CheA
MDFREDREVIDSFTSETLERLSEIEVSLLRIGEGARPFDDVLNAVFRDAHSIKAGANLLKFKNIETLAHRLEDILDRLRVTKTLPSEEVLNAVILALDKMRDLLDDLQMSDSADVSAEVEKLQALGINRPGPKDDIPRDDISKDDISKDDIPKDDIPKDDTGLRS